MNNIVKFQFREDLLNVVEKKEEKEAFVSILSITEIFGLNHAGQCQKLDRADWAKSSMCTMHMQLADGRHHETRFINIRKLPMWLATIDVNRCKPEIQPKLRLYQNEVADALEDRFLGRRGEDTGRIAQLERQLEQVKAQLVELLRRTERQNGLLGSTGANMVRRHIKEIATFRKALQDPAPQLTSVDNEVRAMVDYPKVRGAKWEMCPLDAAAKANGFLAQQLHTLRIRAKNHPVARQLTFEYTLEQLKKNNN